MANEFQKTIKHGDRVTIRVPAGLGRNGMGWAERTGTAVMYSSNGGWVLNMGGKHGTPGIATESNTVKIVHTIQAAHSTELINLWHLSRVALCNRSHGRWERMEWAAREFSQDAPGGEQHRGVQRFGWALALVCDGPRMGQEFLGAHVQRHKYTGQLLPSPGDE